MICTCTAGVKIKGKGYSWSLAKGRQLAMGETHQLRPLLQQLLLAPTLFPYPPCCTRYLLFLRNVQAIEVYTIGSSDTAPILQYSVEVTKRDPPDGWLSVPAFVTGSPPNPLSKEVGVLV